MPLSSFCFFCISLLFPSTIFSPVIHLPSFFLRASFFLWISFLSQIPARLCAPAVGRKEFPRTVVFGGSTLLGALGFSIRIPIGLLAGYFFFIYRGPTAVKCVTAMGRRLMRLSSQGSAREQVDMIAEEEVLEEVDMVVEEEVLLLEGGMAAEKKVVMEVSSFEIFLWIAGQKIFESLLNAMGP